MSNFNGVLADIENIIGVDATIKIAVECGGSHIFIPKKPSEKSGLVQLIGLENVEKLIKDFGTGEVLVPMGHFRGAGKKRARIAKMIEQGTPYDKIARQMDVHTRTVERIKNKNFSNLPLIDFIENLEKDERKNDKR